MSRWGLPPGLAPFDSHVGPFPGERFLEDWYQTVGEGEPLTIEAGGNALPLVVADGRVTIAGHEDVTDYHSPLGKDPSMLAPHLAALAAEHRSVVLDSLPDASAKALGDALEAEATSVTIEEHESTAVVEVVGDYLASLSKKQRHEIRRKSRRFEEAVGRPELSFSTADPEAMRRFVEMHRLADGEKGGFMTPARERLFFALGDAPGWELAELTAGDKPLAGLFGYREPGAYYLYNSAYDPHYREASPGVVALHMLIERLIESDCRRIDLLKGDEIYKFRMGAQRRPLYRISL